MLEINIKEVQEARERRKKHKPKITIILPDEIREDEERVEKVVKESEQNQEKVTRKAVDLKEALLDDLTNQEHETRIARAKLSNQYHQLIKENASQSDFAAHYQKIESHTATLQDLFNKKRFVQKFGRLPENGSAKESMETNNILALKDKRRKLSDKRCKLKAKIKKGEAKRSGKLEEWKVELDQANREYDFVDRKIKQLEYE